MEKKNNAPSPVPAKVVPGPRIPNPFDLWEGVVGPFQKRGKTTFLGTGEAVAASHLVDDRIESCGALSEDSRALCWPAVFRTARLHFDELSSISECDFEFRR